MMYFLFFLTLSHTLTSLLKANLVPLANVVTPNLMILLRCWFTDLAENELPMQYITSMEVYADKA